MVVRSLALILVAVLAGCTSLDVRPIPASARLQKICIKYNADNNVSDLVQVIQEDFSSHGITSTVIKEDKQVACPAVATYTADRWWDMAPYMVDAQITVENDAGFLGSCHYHLAGHGGLDLTKWEGTHAKLDPAIDAMLINYPKKH